MDIYSQEENERIPLLDYAHSLVRALHILSFVIRAMNAIHEGFKPSRRGTRSAKLRPHPPTEQEKAWALEYFIKKTQQIYFNAEWTALNNRKEIPEKSKLESLQPFLDDRGIIRVGGRLNRSHLDYEMKHPAIIPTDSRLAWLIMRQAHFRSQHGGVQVASHFIRQRFWIPRLRSELKRYTRKCVTCARHKPEYQVQLMGELPAERTRPGKPFEASGVDYAGPIHIKIVDKHGKTIITHKGWMVVFVCLKTRAVHLDFVTDLSSDSFIACFERFTARRGRCDRMFSDNGTSFVGAEKAIANAYKQWREDGTVDRVATRGTEWTFMTPAAPHQGGIYEAAVKSMKYHLRRIIGARLMEYQHLLNLLIEVEAILNSRPLSPLSDDPEDILALTPAHFLVGEPLILPPPFRHTISDNLEGRKLWSERRKMIEHFWKRWEVEYLTTLQERKKWRREKENVQVGQLVILKDENLPPAQWKMGRIIETLPGKDGLVRNVMVKTEKSCFKRPVQKICILPVDVNK